MRTSPDASPGGPRPAWWRTGLLMAAMLAGPSAADEPRDPEAAKPPPPLPLSQRRAVAAIERRTGRVERDKDAPAPPWSA